MRIVYFLWGKKYVREFGSWSDMWRWVDKWRWLIGLSASVEDVVKEVESM